MDFKDLEQKTKKELKELLQSTRDELRVLRFQASERQLKKMHTIQLKKKLIARILTRLNAGSA
jgi:large subunit ribosomal protein L29